MSYKCMIICNLEVPVFNFSNTARLWKIATSRCVDLTAMWFYIGYQKFWSTWFYMDFMWIFETYTDFSGILLEFYKNFTWILLTCMQCTEVCFASFLSCESITAIVVIHWQNAPLKDVALPLRPLFLFLTINVLRLQHDSTPAPHIFEVLEIFSIS